MHRPLPGPFHGSLPSPDFEGARSARRMDLCCSVLAVLAGASVWLGAAYGGISPDIVSLTKLSSAAVICTGVIGIWLIQRSAAVPRVGAAILMEAWRRRLTQRALRHAVILGPDEMKARGLAGLAKDLDAWLHGHPGSGSATTTQSAEPWARAQDMLADLYREADFLEEASIGITAEDNRLTGELGRAGAACDTMQTALSHLTDRVVALTSAVGSTTAEAQHVANLSVTLSEQAFAAQCRVAEMDDQSATLQLGVEQVENLLHRLERLSDAAGILPGASETATDVKALAVAARDTVGILQDGLAEMQRHAERAFSAARDLGARVQTQHDLGLGLAHAVAQQGDEVAEVLRILAEAQTGFITLRGSVEAVTRHCPARAAKAEQVRKSAARLPDHADTLATVLRSLPDFAPPVDYDL